MTLEKELIYLRKLLNVKAAMLEIPNKDRSSDFNNYMEEIEQTIKDRNYLIENNTEFKKSFFNGQ